MSNDPGTPTPVQPKYIYDPDKKQYQLQRFTTPAFNNDFPDDPAMYEQLAAPWNGLFQAQQTGYYNPLVTPIPESSPGPVDVAWIAFPNRLIQYLGQQQTPPNPYNLPQATLNAIADSG